MSYMKVFRICASLVLGLAALSCAKPKLVVMPCDEDLGYANQKMHLSNVQFLDENRAIDWFELYMNLEERRDNEPAKKCIPIGHRSTIEQEIERTEHSEKHLR